MLLPSNRFKKNDLEVWNEYEDVDFIHSESMTYKKRIAITEKAITRFINSGKPHFCGISWGKDSVVLADMFLKINPETNIIFVHQVDNMNPHSLDVMKSFLDFHNPKNFFEYSYSYKDSDLTWFKNGKPNKWYRILEEINKKFGCHVTGIRPDESGKRAKRFKIFGMETINSFAPFQFMTHQEIFSYLAIHDLPIHPNYAMTLNGTLDRKRIRVAAIGNKEGDGMGRTQWEKEYYPDILRKIESYGRARSAK